MNAAHLALALACLAACSRSDDGATKHAGGSPTVTFSVDSASVAADPQAPEPSADATPAPAAFGLTHFQQIGHCTGNACDGIPVCEDLGLPAGTQLHGTPCLASLVRICRKASDFTQPNEHRVLACIDGDPAPVDLDVGGAGEAATLHQAGFCTGGECGAIPTCESFGYTLGAQLHGLACEQSKMSFCKKQEAYPGAPASHRLLSCLKGPGVPVDADVGQPKPAPAAPVAATPPPPPPPPPPPVVVNSGHLVSPDSNIQFCYGACPTIQSCESIGYPLGQNLQGMACTGISACYKTMVYPGTANAHRLLFCQ